MKSIVGIGITVGAFALGSAAISYKEYNDYQGKRFNHTEEGVAWRDVYFKKGGKEAQFYSNAGNTGYAVLDGDDSAIITDEFGDKTKVTIHGSKREVTFHDGSSYSYVVVDKEIDQNSFERVNAQTGEKELISKTDRGFYHEAQDADNFEEIEIKNGFKLIYDNGTVAIQESTDFGSKSTVTLPEGQEVIVYMDKGEEIVFMVVADQDGGPIFMDKDCHIIDEQSAINLLTNGV